jgi:alpha,alpha-trehalose-phosphate synthase [UDP-forming]
VTGPVLSHNVAERLGDTRLVVVANREPYIHVKDVRTPSLVGRLVGRKPRTQMRWMQPASGLVTALDPVMRASGGTWVAHGSGSGDRETADSRGRVAVPPDDPAYTLRRVWLTQREEEGYYYGLANGALWPLCHIAYARPVFDELDWREYVEVNRRFADTVLDEIINTKAIVFVQDYHFALLPRMIKEIRPDVVVCQFWHIPWPNPEAFRICPWKEQILDGLLGNDLMAFHIQFHCNNFIETVDRELEARVDREHFAVHRRGHRTFVKPYPISIDPDLWQTVAPGPDWDRDVAATRKRLRIGNARLIMGVDRLDYTKGIPERLMAFERLLDRHPEWRERVVFLQIGAPTRDHLGQYQAFSAEVRTQVQRINRRFGNKHWMPVVYRRQHVSPEEIGAFYRASDLCVVSSLHDGMNLVAKEFVAARSDEGGVLLLSEFTGAARALADVVPVNPFAPDEFAEAMHEGLSMSRSEQQRRMQNLRAEVLSHTVFDWAGNLLSEAIRLAHVSSR